MLISLSMKCLNKIIIIIFIFSINLNRNIKIKGNGKVKKYKCSECEYAFVAKSTLEAHSICHQPFPHVCHCGIGYYQLEDLKSHKKLVHPVQKSEKLKAVNNDIPKLFNSNSKKQEPVPKLKAELKFRQAHQAVALPKVNFKRTISGRYQCPHCMNDFASKVGAQIHYRSIHKGERPHICQICDKGFTQSSVLKNHYLIHTGSRDYACRYCQKAFRTFHTRELHERIHTGVKPYQCTYCKKAFSDPSAFQRHIRIHTGDKKYVCAHCPKTFTDSSALYVHRKRHRHERNHACGNCDKKFYTKSDARLHYKTVHKPELNFQCDYCKKSFSTKMYLSSHIKLRHSSNNKTYNCNLCLKIFKQEEYLQVHMKSIHGGQRNHTCKVCFKQFFHKYRLEEHMVLHSGVKKFECDYCSKRFYIKSHISCHIIRKHLNNVKCEMCKRMFISKFDFEQHKLKISDCCDICGQTFFCKGEKLVHHNNEHILPKKISSYECDHCGSIFSKRCQIIKHILEAHSTPKFVCDYCGKRFALKDAIRSHMRKHLDFLSCNICCKHFYSTLEFYNHKRAGCTVERHSCEICDKSFTKLSSLRKHLSIHMENREKYKCPICPTELYSKASVIRHIKMMHNKKKLKNKRRSGNH